MGLIDEVYRFICKTFSIVTKHSFISYLAKLAHLQLVINCRYSVAQLCTRENMLAHILGMPYIDDVMSFDLLTTRFYINVFSRFAVQIFLLQTTFRIG